MDTGQRAERNTERIRTALGVAQYREQHVDGLGSRLTDPVLELSQESTIDGMVEALPYSSKVELAR